MKFVKMFNEKALFLYFDVDFPSFSAITLWNVVLMEKKDKGDESLEKHEMTHVKQWNKDGFKFLWNYLFKPSKRFEYEAEAFARQVLYEKDNKILHLRLEDYSRFLSEKYSLNKTVDESRDKIISYMRKGT